MATATLQIKPCSPSQRSGFIQQVEAILTKTWFFPCAAVLWGCALLSLGGHGPFRHVFHPNFMSDFAPVYAQTHAWMNGMDPYSPASRLVFWPKQIYEGRGTSLQYLQRRAGMPTPYPIFTFVASVPLALLPWHVAGTFLLTLDLALLFAIIYKLLHFSENEPWRPVIWFLAALSFDPVYAGMLSNNIGVLSAELGVLGWAAARKSPGTAGVILLATATALKPQVGLAFLIYFAVRRDWRIVWQAFALLAAATIIGFVRLESHPMNWVGSYLRDSAAFFQAGGINDFRPQNLFRFDLINLQVILYPLFQNADAANILAIVLTVIFFLLWLKWSRSARIATSILSMACLSAIVLLPIYHRYYDATLLLLPLCWYVAEYRPEKLRQKLSSLLWLLFLAPAAVPIRMILGRGMTENRWLDAFLRSGANWSVLLLAVFMLIELRRACREGENLAIIEHGTIRR
jgi:Glycosyltransferase family 87